MPATIPPTRTHQHLAITKVWDACATRDAILENDRRISRAIRDIYVTFEAGRSKELAWHEAHPMDPADWQAHVERAKQVIKEVADDMAFSRQGFDANDPETNAAIAATQPTRDQISLRNLSAGIKAFDTLQSFLDGAQPLAKQLDDDRAELKAQLHDKAVLVGWTASSSIADFVSTPLHARCPGPVIHGLVFNAIMTGEVWHRAPLWASLLVTLAVGLLTTIVVVPLTPPRALLASAALFASYLLVNGIVLFDYGNLIVNAAGPLITIVVVWAGATVTQLVTERRQRALIRRRFRTYVDPRLVEYVEKHPSKAAFDGERREMTVVFTDLVGFTKLTETLGEETVGLLNELWTRVVPVIRRDGYLNKFLGDGVMFFYGAPETSDEHADHAVRAALELRTLMKTFNDEVTQPRNLPKLGLRIGVSTGFMIVGDAGAGAAASDYTVLGDNVNLGSRLEGASKFFGTDNLMTARTAELAGDQFLFRPIANIRVVGKQQGVPTVEALCSIDEATDAERECIRMTTNMVEAYQAGQFEACLRAADALDTLGGSATLSGRYRVLAALHLDQPGSEPFDPTITLDAK